MHSTATGETLLSDGRGGSLVSQGQRDLHSGQGKLQSSNRGLQSGYQDSLYTGGSEVLNTGGSVDGHTLKTVAMSGQRVSAKQMLQEELRQETAPGGVVALDATAGGMVSQQQQQRQAPRVQKDPKTVSVAGVDMVFTHKAPTAKAGDGKHAAAEARRDLDELLGRGTGGGQVDKLHESVVAVRDPRRPGAQQQAAKADEQGQPQSQRQVQTPGKQKQKVFPAQQQQAPDPAVQMQQGYQSHRPQQQQQQQQQQQKLQQQQQYRPQPQVQQQGQQLVHYQQQQPQQQQQGYQGQLPFQQQQSPSSTPNSQRSGSPYTQQVHQARLQLQESFLDLEGSELESAKSELSSVRSGAFRAMSMGSTGNPAHRMTSQEMQKCGVYNNFNNLGSGDYTLLSSQSGQFQTEGQTIGRRGSGSPQYAAMQAQAGHGVQGLDASGQYHMKSMSPPAVHSPLKGLASVGEVDEEFVSFAERAG